MREWRKHLTESTRPAPISGFAWDASGLDSRKRKALSAEAARQAGMMNLRELVERYEKLAANYGEAVALSAFGFVPEEASRVFTAFDEDYHISRFLHFARKEGTSYLVSGEPVTHLAIDPAIHSLL